MESGKWAKNIETPGAARLVFPFGISRQRKAAVSLFLGAQLGLCTCGVGRCCIFEVRGCMVSNPEWADSNFVLTKLSLLRTFQVIVCYRLTSPFLLVTHVCAARPGTSHSTDVNTTMRAWAFDACSISQVQAIPFSSFILDKQWPIVE